MTEALAVMTITILAVISPGPDFAMVTRNALSPSRRAALLTAAGIGAGVMVHVTYTLLGVGLAVTYAPNLLVAMKYLGAAYLVWLGGRMMLNPNRNSSDSVSKNAVTGASAFRMGFFTNALNPKTSIFVMSLFVQVVDETTSTITRAGYGTFIALAHWLWFTVVALFFGAPALRAKLQRIAPWIELVFGAALVFFGVSLAIANVVGPV